MIEEQGKKKDGQKNWLKEHDSIQVDLLKMKDELIQEDDSIPEFERVDETPEPSILEDVIGTTPEPEREERKLHPGMTIKQMLGGNEKIVPQRKSITSDNPARLEEGTIPSSPDLNSKIANVLQLEHKLKRRKFELEKRSSNRNVPPPPQKPQEVEKKTVIEWEDEKKDVTSISELQERKLPEEPPRPPEMKRGVVEKHIHIPSDTPYPTTRRSKVKNTFPDASKESVLEQPTKPLKEEEKKKKKKGFLSLFNRG